MEGGPRVGRGWPCRGPRSWQLAAGRTLEGGQGRLKERLRQAPATGMPDIGAQRKGWGTQKGGTAGRGSQSRGTRRRPRKAQRSAGQPTQARRTSSPICARSARPARRLSICCSRRSRRRAGAAAPPPAAATPGPARAAAAPGRPPARRRAPAGCPAARRAAALPSARGRPRACSPAGAASAAGRGAPGPPCARAATAPCAAGGGRGGARGGGGYAKAGAAGVSRWGRAGCGAKGRSALPRSIVVGQPLPAIARHPSQGVKWERCRQAHLEACGSAPTAAISVGPSSSGSAPTAIRPDAEPGASRCCRLAAPTGVRRPPPSFEARRSALGPNSSEAMLLWLDSADANDESDLRARGAARVARARREGRAGRGGREPAICERGLEGRLARHWYTSAPADALRRCRPTAPTRIPPPRPPPPPRPAGPRRPCCWRAAP
jgi:hypothetical protein